MPKIETKTSQDDVLALILAQGCWNILLSDCADVNWVHKMESTGKKKVNIGLKWTKMSQNIFFHKLLTAFSNNARMKNYWNRTRNNMKYKGVITFTVLGQISYFLPLGVYHLICYVQQCKV